MDPTTDRPVPNPAASTGEASTSAPRPSPVAGPSNGTPNAAAAPPREVHMMKRNGGTSSRSSYYSSLLSKQSHKISRHSLPLPTSSFPKITRVVSDIPGDSGVNRRASSGPLPATVTSEKKRKWATHRADPGRSSPKRAKPSVPPPLRVVTAQEEADAAASDQVSSAAALAVASLRANLPQKSPQVKTSPNDSPLISFTKDLTPRDISSKASIPAEFELTPSDGVVPEHYETASPGRLYFCYTDRKGDAHRTYGALIPKGYRPQSKSSHPWRCPVLGCDFRYTSLKLLGAHHFRRSHHGTTFRDNGDGTLSRTGVYGDGSGNRLDLLAIVTAKANSMGSVLPSDTAELPCKSEPISHGGTRGRLSLNEPASANATAAPKATAASCPAESPHTKPTRAPASSDAERPGIAELTNLSATSTQIMTVSELQDSSGDFSAPLPPNAELMWNFVKPYINRFKVIPDVQYVKEFLGFPRRRDIVWNTSRTVKAPWTDSVPRDITSLIMHVTGDYAPAPCSRCREGKGPYRGCVLIPMAACQETQSRIYSCSNCLYKCNQTNCSLKWQLQQDFKERNPDLYIPALKYSNQYTAGKDPSQRVGEDHSRRASAPSLLEPPSNAQGEAHRGKSAAKDGTTLKKDPGESPNDSRKGDLPRDESSKLWTSDAGGVEAAAGVGRQLRPRRQAATAIPTPVKKPPVRSSEPITSSVPARSTGKPDKSADNGRAGAKGPVNSHGELAEFTEVSLEMESWETDAGTVISPIEISGRAVAYSSAYMASEHTITASPGISLRMYHVRPGADISLPPEEGRLRICIVSTGKVQVRIDDGERFGIGPNGVVKVEPGARASFQNRLYIEACLHVTSYANLVA